MTTHTPATPLPRNLAVRWTATTAYLESSDGGQFAWTSKTAVGNQLEAIAHAANAYPKLVEALQAMMKTYSVAHDSETEKRLLEQGNAGAIGRALLRSLGEE